MNVNRRPTFAMRLSMLWAMLTRKHFVCYAYDDIDLETGRITGAVMAESLPHSAEESALFLGVVGECVYERCKDVESTGRNESYGESHSKSHGESYRNTITTNI